MRGFAAGSYSDGSAGIPARSADSARVEVLRALLEVRARCLLDAVRAVPEVDRVQVRGEDPVLRPVLLELPGQGRLAHLARDRLLVPDVRVLDELLRDRRAALDDSLLADVLPESACDAAHVDAVVLVEALILDRDDRLAHDRRDVLGADEHAALLAAQHREDAAPVLRVDDRVDVGALRGRIERRDLARDRANEPERERQRRRPRRGRPPTPQDDACEPGAADAATPSLSEPARGLILASGEPNRPQRDGSDGDPMRRSARSRRRVDAAGVLDRHRDDSPGVTVPVERDDLASVLAREQPGAIRSVDVASGTIHIS